MLLSWVNQSSSSQLEVILLPPPTQGVQQCLETFLVIKTWEGCSLASGG